MQLWVSSRIWVRVPLVWHWNGDARRKVLLRTPETNQRAWSRVDGKRLFANDDVQINFSYVYLWVLISAKVTSTFSLSPHKKYSWHAKIFHRESESLQISSLLNYLSILIVADRLSIFTTNEIDKMGLIEISSQCQDCVFQSSMIEALDFLLLAVCVRRVPIPPSPLNDKEAFCLLNRARSEMECARRETNCGREWKKRWKIF